MPGVISVPFFSTIYAVSFTAVADWMALDFSALGISSVEGGNDKLRYHSLPLAVSSEETSR